MLLLLMLIRLCILRMCFESLQQLIEPKPIGDCWVSVCPIPHEEGRIFPLLFLVYFRIFFKELRAQSSSREIEFGGTRAPPFSCLDFCNDRLLVLFVLMAK